MRTPLGQNFLTDESIAKKIVELASIQDTNVLEIGPGKGILTKYLAEKAGGVLAVEIDEGLAALLPAVIASVAKQSRAIKKNTGLLRRHAPRNDNLKIVTGDILKLNLPKIIEENDFQNYKVVANLPYYITSKIIRLLLETQYPPSVMILMVQKEVGERIAALDGKESILSISVKFYADPEILFHVPREKFNPAPEVDSVVIRIKRKSTFPEVFPVKSADTIGGARQAQFNRVDSQKFFSLVRAGFSSKRKMLANNLSACFNVSKEDVVEKIKKAGLNPEIRAEKLNLDNWMKLFKLLIK